MIVLALAGLLAIATIVIVAASRGSSSAVTGDDARLAIDPADTSLVADAAGQVAIADDARAAASDVLVAGADASGLIPPDDRKTVVDAGSADGWIGFERPRPPSDARTTSGSPFADAGLGDAPVDAGRGDPPKSNWDNGVNHWADYSATRFDASAYLARAQQLAREMVPGTTLAEMQVPWVYPDGHVVLGISENPSYAFHAPGSKPCIVFISPSPNLVGTHPVDTACKRGAGLPRCTVRQVLARAAAMGAVLDPAPDSHYGPRNFVTWDGRWQVTVKNKSHTTTFSETLDDNC